YVVRSSAKELGGTVELATQIGKGTRFTMRLPMTTAIMQMLMVAVGEYIFGIPSDVVLETLEVKPEDIKEIRDDKVLLLRNEIIPFVKLNEVLNIPCQEDPENLIAVIINRGNKFMGLGVDSALDQMENIVKPFDPIAQQFKGFSGGTILGDGRIALLLDIPTLFGFKTLEEKRCST
ncbi:MAG: chemotaxis protein CheW, partial [Pseudomonadota bacterium]